MVERVEGRVSDEERQRPRPHALRDLARVVRGRADEAERELRYLGQVLEHPEHPFVANTLDKDLTHTQAEALIEAGTIRGLFVTGTDVWDLWGPGAAFSRKWISLPTANTASTA